MTWPHGMKPPKHTPSPEPVKDKDGHVSALDWLRIRVENTEGHCEIADATYEAAKMVNSEAALRSARVASDAASSARKATLDRDLDDIRAFVDDDGPLPTDLCTRRDQYLKAYGNARRARGLSPEAARERVEGQVWYRDWRKL